ncbi:VCBS repeat-containing protein [Polyangium sp. 15x6]|uniref:FG-GAP repeat domain-containing protein n=1 Tax=Polyangium sp. 15x6 TaxID=3042687 RepID=UPI00249A78FB|nr:VCBS repeat-containing protein [Polyangium sp. 15x6]MDI3290826.1 VCBS repeat-containing protein [Polyangium sp. 15x6]
MLDRFVPEYCKTAGKRAERKGALGTALGLGLLLALLPGNASAFNWPSFPHDNPATTDSWRFGGGRGYPDVFTGGNKTPATFADLKNLLRCTQVVDQFRCPQFGETHGTAVSGDVVMLGSLGNPTDTIELEEPICIPAGVTLAGGRGANWIFHSPMVWNSPGFRLKQPDGTTQGGGVIHVCGDDVRITGLRIEGIDPDYFHSTPSAGVVNHGFDNLEIDNCEISGFGKFLIGLNNGSDDHITDVHHNYLHHSRARVPNGRYGQGVAMLDPGVNGELDMMFRWNRASQLRVVLDSDGSGEFGYEARDNLVYGALCGFQTHGWGESSGGGQCGACYDDSFWCSGRLEIPDNEDSGLVQSFAYCSYAMDEISVHDNTIWLSVEEDSPEETRDTLYVRGIPLTGAHYFDNCSNHPEECEDHACGVAQKYYLGNVWNDGGNTWEATDLEQCGNTERWCRRTALVGPPHYGPSSQGSEGLLNADPTGRNQTGDFNGDGKEDIFLVMRNGLGELSSTYFIPSSVGSTWHSQTVVPLAVLPSSTEGVRLGDFDNDGTTDILAIDGCTWRFFSGGTGTPTTVTRTDECPSVDNIVVFDNLGNGASDILSIIDGRFKVSLNGTGAFSSLKIASPVTSLSQTRIGDFNGDGWDDIFTVGANFAGSWSIAWAGFSDWDDVKSTSTTINQLQVADVDGDGKDDIVGDWEEFSLRWVQSLGTAQWGLSSRLMFTDGGLPPLMANFDGTGIASAMSPCY